MVIATVEPLTERVPVSLTIPVWPAVGPSVFAALSVPLTVKSAAHALENVNWEVRAKAIRGIRGYDRRIVFFLRSFIKFFINCC